MHLFPPLQPHDPSDIAGYRVHALLGSGGMGRVYLAYTPGGRPVALKTVRPEFAEDPEFRARFAHEVANARCVHGLYTAQVVDAGTDDPTPWLATAYVPGPSVHQAVRDHGALPVRTVLLLIGGVAEALQAIHRAGVVHRDLKPANVLLAADGPRVIDFGIARAADAVALTGAGLVVGSPSYMAPEQVLDRPITPAADIFALGALAAFAAGGIPPFPGGPAFGSVVHQDPDLGRVPHELRGLLTRCLAKDPSDRPTPAELIDIARRHPAVGGELRFAEGWLPARVSADISRRADPAARATGSGAARPTAVWPAGRAEDGAARATVVADATPTVVAGAPRGTTVGAPVETLVGPHPTPVGPAASGPHRTARLPVDRAPVGPGRRRRGVRWRTVVLVAAVTAVLGTVGGILVIDHLDRFLDGPGAADAAPPGAATASPGAGPVGTPAPGAPSPAAGPRYSAVYTAVTLTAPDDSYDFDIRTGALTPAESTPWAIGHTNGEFLAPDASDAYLAPGGELTAEQCATAADQRPVTRLTFADASAGRAFCVRSRSTRDIAVVRVVAAATGGPVTVSMDYYRAGS
ncbi:serine/threonine-protein kinase [Longispora sp. K20-0274]|uniref:serine/threonine-protein kinase n=1 Tax=Longispora sp. K20-0274 TaxID=3088255 RepID=UPI00399B88D2